MGGAKNVQKVVLNAGHQTIVLNVVPVINSYRAKVVKDKSAKREIDLSIRTVNAESAIKIVLSARKNQHIAPSALVDTG
jgi:hypothetical protein